MDHQSEIHFHIRMNTNILLNHTNLDEDTAPSPMNTHVYRMTSTCTCTCRSNVQHVYRMMNKQNKSRPNHLKTCQKYLKFRDLSLTKKCRPLIYGELAPEVTGSNSAVVNISLFIQKFIKNAPFEIKNIESLVWLAVFFKIVAYSANEREECEVWLRKKDLNLYFMYIHVHTLYM